MPYRLYITNKNYSSWSFRPWLLMRQLGIPFVEDLRPLVSGSYRQPQWRAFSPLAHVPCLHVLPPADSPTADVVASAQAEPPIVLWESLAIVEFLAEEHPGKAVYPADRAARAWARSAVAEMHAGFATMRQEMGMNVGVRIELGADAFTEGLVRDLERVNELWREGLSRFGGPFLAGSEFTAVDAFYAPVVLRLVSYLGALDRMGDEAKAYVKRVSELEGVREWVEEALKETGREELHEEECLQGEGRKLVEDLRVKAK
ncbi:Putative maleylacetoacetate isomerase [Madurella fahalii]|uniref:Maleylacetoacetate isomerase n=1 Tax=Madurella fahalii TaxID=1157608 RepID=A0ABQ0GB62_9PEZI